MTLIQWQDLSDIYILKTLWSIAVTECGGRASWEGCGAAESCTRFESLTSLAKCFSCDVKGVFTLYAQLTHGWAGVTHQTNHHIRPHCSYNKLTTTSSATAEIACDARHNFWVYKVLNNQECHNIGTNRHLQPTLRNHNISVTLDEVIMPLAWIQPIKRSCGWSKLGDNKSKMMDFHHVGNTVDL